MEKVKTLGGFLHTWISCIIVLVVGSLFYYVFKTSPVKSALIGYAAALIAGALKEFLWDKKLARGVFSWTDLMADFIGSTTGLVVGLVLFCNTNH